MEATKLPLTTWFLAFYLIGQAKTGISSLALMRQLGRSGLLSSASDYEWKASE